MIIAINLLSDATSDTGGKTFLDGFLHGLAALKSDDEFLLLSHPNNRQLAPELPSNFRWFFPPHVAGRFHRVYLERSWLPATIIKHRAHIFLSINSSIPSGLPIPSVVIIQNILSFFPNRDEGLIRGAYRRWLLPRSLKEVAAAVVPSHYAHTVVSKKFPEALGRLSVIPFGISPRTSNTPAPLNKPFVLWVSALWGYKNWAVALEAYALLIRRFGYPHRFCLVGRATENRVQREVERRIRDLKIADRVSHFPALTTDQIRALYRDAAVLLYPSRIESFGFPVLEAMAMGTPFITSDCPSLVEIAGDAGRAVEPTALKLMEAMHDVFSDTTATSQRVERGQHRVKNYTWLKTADQVLNLLHSVIDKSTAKV